MIIQIFAKIHSHFSNLLLKFTNLNLLLVRSSHSACYININVDPVDIQYSPGEEGRIPACNKMMMNSYPRKKLLGCSDKNLTVSVYAFLSINYTYKDTSCSFILKEADAPIQKNNVRYLLLFSNPLNIV